MSIDRDDRTFYWCLYHKNNNKGYPDGLYACSLKVDQYDEYIVARNTNVPFCINATPQSLSPQNSSSTLAVQSI